MTLRLRSVRARLTLWHAGVLTVLVCVFSAGIFLLVRARLFEDLDAHLERDLATVERTYREEPGELSEAELRAGINLFEVTGNGTVLYRTEGWTQKELERALGGRGGASAISWRSPEGQPFRIHTVSHASHRISVAADESAIRGTLRALAIILALAIPCAIGLAIAGGYFLAGRVLAPVGAMAEHARRITAESLGKRLPVENPQDELGQLATIFNETLVRLQDSFERLRRFTADASHELRTPLTAMRSVGEVALHDGLDPGAYRDVIGSMLEEVTRLTGLVESLLMLTRAESGSLRRVRNVVDLAGLAAGAADHLRVLAEEKEQTLTVDSPGAVMTECDAALLRQGIVNLVDNAIKYSPPKGAIRISVKTLPSGEAAIEVKDNGPGIAREHIERIFDRFYRVDDGRSRSAGGMGLGLAIARSTIEASGGRIEVESEENRGSVFRVVFPSKP